VGGPDLGQETKIINQVFTFDLEREVRVGKEVEESPKKRPKGGRQQQGCGHGCQSRSRWSAAAVASVLRPYEQATTKQSLGCSVRLLDRKRLPEPERHAAGQPHGEVHGRQVDMNRRERRPIAATWTDLDPDGQPKTDEAFWVLRHESMAGRVAVCRAFFPGEPPLLLNFEDRMKLYRSRNG